MAQYPLLLVIAAVTAAGGYATAQERKPSQPVYRYLHEAKVVCGQIGMQRVGPLPQGHYSTAINLYNPHSAATTLDFDLRLANPPGQLQAGDVVALEPIELPSGDAISVDCRTLKAQAFSYGYPSGFIDGMLSAAGLQPLVVTAVYTSAAPGEHHGHQRLTSLDVENISARAVEVWPPDANWPEDGTEETFCDTLRRTSAVITGTVVSQSYTFDEAPEEGPREVSRIEDVGVVAGSGAVVGGPVEIRLRRGFLPDGRFVDTSEMPVLTEGARYLFLLPNHGWVHEAVSLDDVLRIVDLNGTEVLVDQHGFAVTNTEGGRSVEPVSEPEFLFRSPQLTGNPPPGNALSPEEFGMEIDEVDCPDPVLTGPFTAYPLVPARIRGME
ncbi:MAG: hypothetical protein ACU0FH_17925 [Heliomarina sp.]|uniref:hypothetical protein n=1 Tax=Heliomarina sp. TaxID=2917556 RepID=UPI0040582065